MYPSPDCCAAESGPRRRKRGLAAPVPTRSAAIIVGERGERGLRLAGHVGIGVAEPGFEHLDDAGAGQVEIVDEVYLPLVRRRGSTPITRSR